MFAIFLALVVLVFVHILTYARYEYKPKSKWKVRAIAGFIALLFIHITLGRYNDHVIYQTWADGMLIMGGLFIIALIMAIYSSIKDSYSYSGTSTSSTSYRSMNINYNSDGNYASQKDYQNAQIMKEVHKDAYTKLKRMRGL